jgi:hypothetical protein
MAPPGAGAVHHINRRRQYLLYPRRGIMMRVAGPACARWAGYDPAGDDMHEHAADYRYLGGDHRSRSASARQSAPGRVTTPNGQKALNDCCLSTAYTQGEVALRKTYVRRPCEFHRARRLRRWMRFGGSNRKPRASFGAAWKVSSQKRPLCLRYCAAV